MDNTPELSILDFISTDNSSNRYNNNNNEKVKGYRKQVEYGAKKYIKPWRTGSKSQQIPNRANGKNNR